MFVFLSRMFVLPTAATAALQESFVSEGGIFALVRISEGTPTFEVRLRAAAALGNPTEPFFREYSRTFDEHTPIPDLLFEYSR